MIILSSRSSACALVRACASRPVALRPSPSARLSVRASVRLSLLRLPVCLSPSVRLCVRPFACASVRPSVARLVASPLGDQPVN